jgi:hypothetical protein
MARSTSFRISEAARSRLSARAAQEGLTATALLDQLIVEGIDQLDYPGVIFRGPAHDRRTTVMAIPAISAAGTTGLLLSCEERLVLDRSAGGL